MAFINPSRQSALKSLAGFVPSAGHKYRNCRNEDRGGSDRSNVSLLSPYLRHRVISEDEVLRQILAAHPLPKVRKFVEEIFWRGYWKGWLEQHPQVWFNYLEALEELERRLLADDPLCQAFTDAEAGRTGIGVFDAWVDELKDTGYLHNHARMWFASIWVFTLGLPWQLGAQLFLRHLYDGDPASNTLSWRWVAGLHTSGKSYVARPENIARFSRGRFDAQTLNLGMKRLTPECAALSEPSPAGYVALDLPADRILPGDGVLLLTEERLDLQTRCVPARVVAIQPQSTQYVPLSSSVVRFKTALLDDALARATKKWPSASVIPEPIPVHDITRYLPQGCDVLVTSYCPIGPVRMSLGRQWSNKCFADVIEEVADYDRIVWPRASKGFYRLGRNIEEVLVELNLYS